MSTSVGGGAPFRLAAACISAMYFWRCSFGALGGGVGIAGELRCSGREADAREGVGTCLTTGALVVGIGGAFGLGFLFAVDTSGGATRFCEGGMMAALGVDCDIGAGACRV